MTLIMIVDSVVSFIKKHFFSLIDPINELVSSTGAKMITLITCGAAESGLVASQEEGSVFETQLEALLGGGCMSSRV